MTRSDKLSHSPFARLGELVKPVEADREASGPTEAAEPKAAAAPRSESRARQAPEVDERTLFAREMAGVAPISRGDRVSRVRSAGSPPPSSEALALQELDALVSGKGYFDLSATEEHIEGIAKGIDRRLLRDLRRGKYACRVHLDLHGHTRREARAIVERFLGDCRARNERCVLIVHGRGLNSPDRIPVLKESLAGWLTRGRIARSVLAFCSARPSDGGLGAVYVLLRKA